MVRVRAEDKCKRLLGSAVVTGAVTNIIKSIIIHLSFSVVFGSVFPDISDKGLPTVPLVQAVHSLEAERGIHLLP